MDFRLLIAACLLVLVDHGTPGAAGAGPSVLPPERGSVVDAAPSPPAPRARAAMLTVRNLNVIHSPFAIYILPGEPVPIRGVDGPGAPSWKPASPLPALKGGKGNSWVWTAPKKPGHYPVTMVRGADTVRLNFFVMLPFSALKRGKLNGYTIGTYPKTPLRGLAIYRPPRGFVEVTQANAGVRVSPNFTLGQFLCKQEAEFPKYVVLREELLLVLEAILDKLEERLGRRRGLTIMSGYRTPSYNRDIDNVAFSRHLWGGAADIFVDDTPEDGTMDDLNGDGKVDRLDAQWLASLIDEMVGADGSGLPEGGIAVYETTELHGPFVHVDVRGTKARW